MSQTWAEIVVELEAAKTAILSGAQSYSIAGRSASRGDLSAIMSELRHAKIMAAREASGGITIRQITPVDA
jgi:hypothetical protein